MPYVFGPVPSRRLGLSMGVDLIPPKTCTYDCLYCQVGRTTSQVVTPAAHAPVEAVAAELRRKLMKKRPDVITLAGSGEPTLHSEIDRVIESIHDITEIPVALLTNGSLFWMDDVRKRSLGADIILPTLSTANEATFRRIHRPHPELRLEMVAGGLKRLRKEYRGRIFLEVMLLSGVNDLEAEISALKDLIAGIAPDRIQLNTVVRPPSDAQARPLDRRRMEEIRNVLGERAEIVAEFGSGGTGKMGDPAVDDLLEMLRRRPLRQVDVEEAMGLATEEAEDLIKGLLIKGHIHRQSHSGEIYYLSDEKDEH
jgi:wyosine [tRNA(Phe)-imidazoG37] synthetase (radical SAM superfamily)